LQWLHDKDIKITIDPDAAGAYWNGTKIVLGRGFANAPTFIHEANHAKYTKQGRTPNVYTRSRRAYVRAAINEETDGTVIQIRAAKEFREAGRRIGRQPAEAAYDAAYGELGTGAPASPKRGRPAFGPSAGSSPAAGL
jgi:hypothetical protein